jgi:dTDP-4-amino-4,6-dideoxygalactose transaminase
MPNTFVVRPDFLVFGEPVIGADEIDAVVENLRSKWVGTGPRVQEFQTAFAERVGARHAIATNSCTAALHLCMLASGIGAGDEVITTPMTFCATANAILHTGARPVFVDCDYRTGNIDTEQIVSKITPRTRAILPVHFAGHPCDMNEIRDVADRHDLTIIEDCAHAIEAKYEGKNCGTFGKAGAFSFYVTKNITTVEGGMIVTDDKEFADRLRILSLHGMSRDAWKRFSDTGYKHYSVVDCGYKYNMTDLAAALGLCQLAKIDMFHSRRVSIWRRYETELSDLPLVLPAPVPDNWTHALHLYTVRLDTQQAGLSRDDFLCRLQALNIGTGVHYVGLQRHPLYQQFGCVPEDFPVSESISEQTLSLPLSAAMSDQDTDDVVAAVRHILREL